LSLSPFDKCQIFCTHPARRNGKDEELHSSLYYI
jgi:hypothetical protein